MSIYWSFGISTRVRARGFRLGNNEQKNRYRMKCTNLIV
nr:MAG TPA: hypothetical protein [Caudoviricetes sp.]